MSPLFPPRPATPVPIVVPVGIRPPARSKAEMGEGDKVRGNDEDARGYKGGRGEGDGGPGAREVLEVDEVGEDAQQRQVQRQRVDKVQSD